MFRFILHSYIFKQVLFAAAVVFVISLILNVVFEKTWKSKCNIPVTNLNDVYKIPPQYDNFPKLNLKLEEPGKLSIEANKRFIISGSGKEFGFFDTVYIIKPDTGLSYTNRIYIYFENSQTPDSVYLTISKSEYPDACLNQIFYSSVRIENLNEFSNVNAEFRIKPSILVSKEMLENNDSLINEVINYFNINNDNLGLSECENNSKIFKSICENFSVPCRIVYLQGGNTTDAALDINVGYPYHAICEVYSSRYNKWFVIDPSYGFAFLYKNIPLNAVEISDKVYFLRENEIEEDSVLTTRSLPLNLDYLRYYENVYFISNFYPNIPEKIFMKLFYGKYKYGSYIYSNKITSSRNATGYLILKSAMYLLLTLLYILIIIIILIRRLLKSKNVNIPIAIK